MPFYLNGVLVGDDPATPAAPGVATVETPTLTGGQIHVTESVPNPNPSPLPAVPAVVTFGLQGSIQLDQFRYAKPMVQLAMPCRPEDVDECFKYCVAWVDSRYAEIAAGISQAVSTHG